MCDGHRIAGVLHKCAYLFIWVGLPITIGPKNPPQIKLRGAVLYELDDVTCQCLSLPTAWVLLLRMGITPLAQKPFHLQRCNSHGIQ